MSTRELIEAVRADGIEWEDHRGRVVMLAEDHDALRAACAAVLDEVVRNCRECIGTGVARLEMEVGPDKRIERYYGQCPQCRDARALREKL